MPDLEPVDYQPDFIAPQGQVAQQVAGFPQRAADLAIGALGPLGEAGMTVGDALRTGHLDPRDIPQIAGGVMLGTMAPEMEEAAPVEAGAQAVAKGITAYHGSPYDFDKFDISRIGTGEGAQAYGHGLYFAEEPRVAQDYRDQLSNRVYSGGKFDVTNPADIASKALINSSPEQAIASIQRRIDVFSKPGPGGAVDLGPDRAAIELIRSGQAKSTGRMYQVSIAADPEHFLDWDKPLSKQSAHVQGALKTIGLEGDPAGVEVYQNLRDSAPEGASLFEHLPYLRTPQEASELLRDAGITGIKYLDQGSRGSGNGTHNYVVFDPSIIDIIKKYGIAGLIAGGAAHFSTTPVENNPFQ